MTKTWRASFTNSMCQRKPSFGIHIVLYDFLKTRSEELALKRHGHSYFWAWLYWICICRSFHFRRNIYGMRVFKWITQLDLLKFALVKLLVFTPLFNAQIKLVKLFCSWDGCNLLLGRRERIFSTQEEHKCTVPSLFVICDCSNLRSAWYIVLVNM